MDMWTWRKGRARQTGRLGVTCIHYLGHSLDRRESKGIPEKIYLCFIGYAFDYVDHNKLWKALKEMGVPDHLTWLLRNLYEGQEATVS